MSGVLGEQGRAALRDDDTDPRGRLAYLRLAVGESPVAVTLATPIGQLLGLVGSGALSSDLTVGDWRGYRPVALSGQVQRGRSWGPLWEAIRAVLPGAASSPPSGYRARLVRMAQAIPEGRDGEFVQVVRERSPPGTLAPGNFLGPHAEHVWGEHLRSRGHRHAGRYREAAPELQSVLGIGDGEAEEVLAAWRSARRRRGEGATADDAPFAEVKVRDLLRRALATPQGRAALKGRD